jgi:hypothetical protein
LQVAELQGHILLLLLLLLLLTAPLPLVRFCCAWCCLVQGWQVAVGLCPCVVCSAKWCCMSHAELLLLYVVQCAGKWVGRKVVTTVEPCGDCYLVHCCCFAPDTTTAAAAAAL